MELEDALTIFSYSSPYPVQLSLLPATTAVPPAARTPRGRRSWSLGHLDTRRRQRPHSDLPRLRPARRSHSDDRAPRAQPCAAENSKHDLRHRGELVQATDESQQATAGQSSHPSDQLRPATVHDHSSSSPALRRHEQQHEECGKADQTTVQEASFPKNGGDSSVQHRSVDEQAAASLAERDSVKLTTADDVDSDVFYDDDSSNSDATNITGQRSTRKKKHGLITSLRALLKSGSVESKRKSRKWSMEGGAVAYVHPDEDSTSVVYIVRGQNRDDSNCVGRDEVSTLSETNTNDQHKSIDTASEFVDCRSSELLSTQFDDVNAETHASDVRRQRDSAQPRVEEPQTGSMSDGSRLQERISQSEITLVTNSPSTKFEELRGITKTQETTGGDDSPKQLVDSGQSTVVDGDVLVAGDHGDDRQMTTVRQAIQDVHKAETCNEDLTGVNQQRAAVSFTELEAELSNIRPPSLFDTDEDGARTPVIHNDVDVQEQTTITNRDFINAETNNVSLTADKDNGANTMRDSCEANFDAEVQRSGTKWDPIAEQETLDVGPYEENIRPFGVVAGVGDEEYGMPPPDDESPQQPDELDGRRLDVSDFDLSQPVVIEVTEPTVSAATPDMTGTVPARTATRPQVAKDEKSPENDLDDVSDNNCHRSVVIELADQTVPTSTSVLDDSPSSAQPQVVKGKSSSTNDLREAKKVTADVPSALTMLLNLIGVGHEAKQTAKPTDDQASSGHCVVAMETPTITSGETNLASVNDGVVRSRTSTAETEREDTQVDNRYKGPVEHAVAGTEFDGNDSSFVEQSPEQNHSADNRSDAQSLSQATFSDSEVITSQTATVEGSAGRPVIPSSDEGLNVDESRTKLNIGDDQKAAQTSDSRSLSHREMNVCQHPDTSETASVAPSVSNSRDRNPSLVMGGNHSSLSGIVDDEEVSQTAKDVHDKQTTRQDYDPAEVAVMGSVEESRNRISNNETARQPHVIGVPVTRGNQLPINSPEVTSPTKQHAVVRPSSSDFTFVFQRPMKADHNYERSLSTGSSNNTGSSNDGKVSRKPAYTFVMPTVRRRSDLDYSNNDFPTTRPSSMPQTVSDGPTFDIRNTSVMTPRYTEINSGTYNSRQIVRHAVVSGQRPVRTGSGNVFDRKQTDSVEQATVSVRLSESMKEERVSTRQYRSLTSVISPSDDETVPWPVSGHVTGSMPDLQPGVDDASRSLSRRDVMASSHGSDVTNDDDDSYVTRDSTPLRLDARHFGVDAAGVHDFCRSEPCLDVAASFHARDVKNDDTSHDVTRLLGDGDAETGSVTSSAEDHQVSRLTVKLGSNSGVSSAQNGNNRRRPRRRRIVCLSHSSLDPATTNNVTSPPPTTDH